jgi:group I intron endonuclease
MIGIYTITNLKDNKIYLGCSTKIEERLGKHKRNLKSGKHPNIHLQNAYNKYGEDKFQFEILEECSEELLYSQENYWANLLNVHNMLFGYNIAPTNPMNKHYCISEATRQKISVASKNKIFTEEYRLKLSKAQVGRAGTTNVRITRIEDNKMYLSIKDAAKDINRHHSTIYKQLKGITKTAAGFTYRYSE